MITIYELKTTEENFCTNWKFYFWKDNERQ